MNKKIDFLVFDERQVQAAVDDVIACEERLTEARNKLQDMRRQNVSARDDYEKQQAKKLTEGRAYILRALTEPGVMIKYHSGLWSHDGYYSFNEVRHHEHVRKDAFRKLIKAEYVHQLRNISNIKGDGWTISNAGKEALDAFDARKPKT